VCKIVATCATVGSGAIGGVFTPTLFVGAALGTLFGHATQALWPSLAPSPHAYTMVGMGAFLAAATQAPLMAIVIIFEMTLSYAIVLPLMLACVVAYFAARLVGEHSMYSAAIRRARRSEGWRSTVIAELVKPAQTCVRNDATFDEIKRSFLAHPVRYLYVLDSEERFIGAIAFDRVKTSLLAPGAPVPPIGELVQQDIPTLTPDLRLGDALQRFLAHRGERLPVVRAADDPRLLGTVSKSDLLLRIEQAAASR